jgi:hypothetical protein
MRTELGRKQRDFDQILMKLHRALEAASWREVIQHADQILAIAPEHAEARKARARAWRAVEPPTVTPAKPEKDEVKVAVAEEPSRRFLLWIDGVGGYLVCLSYRVSFGQATPESYVDIPLLADVSRLHGYLTRDAEGYLLESVRPVSVNDKITDRALLQDGDRLTIGGSCRLQFQKPVELSATARLDVISSHRLPLAVDGVILMADNLILGSGEGAHVLVPDLRRPVVLYRKKECLAVRAAGDMTVDGHKARDKANLGPASTVTGDDFRFTLEPIGAHMGINKMRA